MPPNFPVQGDTTGTWGTVLNTWLGQGGQVYDVVAGYSADPTGVADSTTAIASAVTAAATSGGIVYFPPGTYKANVTLSSRTAVRLQGAGAASIIKPASGTAVSISSCTRCEVRDLFLDGSGGGAIGLSVSGNGDGKFAELFIQGFSGDGIAHNGDTSGGEISYTNITCRNNGGIGYHVTRTTTTDTGGVYITNLRCNFDTQGTSGVKLESSAASETAIYHWFKGLTVDGYGTTNPGIWIHDVAQVYIHQFWCAGTNSTGASFLIDGTHNPNGILVHGGYIFNGSTAASTYDLSVNAGSDMFFDDIHFDGSPGGAIIHVGSTGANFLLGNYDLTTTSALTDTTAALFHTSNFMTNMGPILVQTKSGGVSTETFAIGDTNNPTKQRWIRNNNGNLEFLNNAFSSTVFRIDDGGFIFCGSGVMPAGNTTGACTLYSGSGAPGAGLGANGDFYFRSDGVGGNVRLYFKTGGAWVGLLGTQSTLQTLVGSDTIATAGVSVARVTCTANRASVILAVGTFDGQEVTVVNEGSFTVTFAASGTSHVADGVSDVIASLTARKFIWDSGTSLWYRAA